jgi:hypothetical protein
MSSQKIQQELRQLESTIQEPILGPGLKKKEEKIARDIWSIASPNLYLTPEYQRNIEIIINDVLYVRSNINGLKDFDEEWAWKSNYREIENSIDKLCNSLQEFWPCYEDYFNNIDPEDILTKLQALKDDGVNNWKNLPDMSELQHQEEWEKVQISEEFRLVAYYGKEVYDSLFPPRSKIRKSLDDLEPGDYLKIRWFSGSEWRAHIPWGLMYQFDIPQKGQPIDPFGFFGLRYRIEHRAYPINPDDSAIAESLGSIEETHRIHYLYWGIESTYRQEAERLQKILASKWPNQHFVPDIINRDIAKETSLKEKLIESLNFPEPNPVNLLYFYCRFTENTLQFGDRTDLIQDDVIRLHELKTDEFLVKPLVFVNACKTIATNKQITNQLVKHFFRRKCAAYLGTEIDVPPKFACCFAIIFFHFFYNTPCLSAGEAISKTKLFLWQYYKNIGGLFYTYKGPYELHLGNSIDNIDNILSKMRGLV